MTSSGRTLAGRSLAAATLPLVVLGIALTYSRGGLLALIISGSVCVWEYAVKGKRRYILVIAGFILLLGVATVAANSP